jgi:ATP-dependent Lon protease
LAAKRSGIKEIIMSQKNQQDVDEIEARYLKGLTLHFVSTMKEVLDLALLKEKVKEAKSISLKNKN